MRKGFLRAAAFAALFAGLAAAASAQVTVSGGFALSSMKVEESDYSGDYSIDGDIGFGGNILVDYLLPIGIPLSLGFEVGYDTASVEDSGYEITGHAIPLLARLAYHFDLIANLDLYLVGKIGYVLGGVKDDYDFDEDGINGMGFGFDVGAAYYFTPRIGVFAEAGFERYSLEKKIDDYYYYDGDSYNDSYTIKAPFSRFVIVGISFKF
jgi:opacity protein-like surface antigen